MDLWIRSQYKMILVKVNQININYQNGRQIIANYTPDFIRKKCYEILGTYKSEERALEVLDEIQERIINLQLVNLEEKGTARKDAYKKEYLRCVYEMPEE